MIKTIINYLIKWIVLSPILYVYEKYVLYRIRDAWGVVHLWNIKNKGRNVKLVGYSRFINPERLHIGNNVRIGYNCFLFCQGGIRIGDNSILSRNITIYSGNHNYDGDAVPYDNRYINKEVVIGDSVWIAMNVCILPGVHIGDGAIVGMGAIISKNVAAGEIVVGSQQRVVGKRDIAKFNELRADGKIYTVLYPKE